MEIVTYVRTGAITHQDLMGNKGRTGAGDVQVMSAGPASPTPNIISRMSRRLCSRSGSKRTGRRWSRTGVPRNSRRAPRQGAFQLLASGDADDGALEDQRRRRMIGATVKAGESIAVV